jgi:hypothetical protein
MMRREVTLWMAVHTKSLHMSVMTAPFFGHGRA